MKIGLLTFHDTTNYGANLQAFALNKILNDLGYNCETIDYQCDMIKKRELPNIITNGTLRNFIGSCIRFPKRFIKHKLLLRFIYKNEKLSKNKYTKQNISKTNDIYDRFIIGSDILWNLEINGGDLSFFLDFVTEDKKKFSFATSIGEPWNEIEKQLIQPLLKKFNRIAVREQESVSWVSELTEKNTELVCDPTMLITSKEWSLIANKKIKGNYVLVYLPNDKCLKDAAIYAKQHNSRVEYLYCYDSIERFLSKIKNADCIFTGSYHGFLFSLYFHTPIMFYNFQDTARMRFLSKIFKIENHEATTLVEVSEIPKTDWEYVDNQLESFRTKSINYLKDVLK